MKRIYKKVEVNSAILKEWMEDNEKTKTDVASMANLSVMQVQNLMRKPDAGSQSIAHLVGLNIPRLFQLVTYEVLNRKTRIVTKQNMIIAIAKGENNG